MGSLIPQSILLLLATSLYIVGVNGRTIPEKKIEKRRMNFACPTQDDVITIEDVQDAYLNSKFAYKDTIAIGELVTGSQYRVKFIQQEKVYDGDTTGVRVIITERGSTTVVAFRGTDSDDQLLYQAIRMIKFFHGVDDITANTHAKVNEFFLTSFKLLYPSIRHQLVDQSRRYIITGHSLGGAMATLLALKMTQYENGKMWENPRTSLITFGEPRVGNADFAKLHDRLIPTYKKLRFILEKDPVPHIPLWPTFLHHSREVLLDYERGWFWSKGERYWRVCNKEEELMCSNFYTLLPNVNDHDMAKYGEFIMKPPNKFKDRLKNNKNSFEDSIISSCQSTAKRSTQYIEDGVMQLTKRVLVALDKEV